MAKPEVQRMTSEASTSKDAGEPEQVFTLVRKGRFDEALSLLQRTPSLWHQVEADGRHSLLHWAALSGNVPFISHAVGAHLEVDIRAENGQTPLMWAMTRGHAGVAKILLEAKADAHAKDSMGASPLILAVQHKQHSCILLLLAKCPREELLRVRDEKGCGPVHWAAYKGDLTGLRLLDYFNADFSFVDGEKMSPLHRAVQANQDGVCEFLLDKLVDPSLLDSQGRTCMEVARQISAKSTEHRLKRLLEEKPAGGASAVDPEAGAGATPLRRRKKEETDRWREMAVQNAAATFWLVCVSLASFQYLTELRSPAWSLAPNFAMAFELGVPICLTLFVAVAWADPGKVPPRRRHASGVEEILKALQGTSDQEAPDFGRLCTTTWVIKGLRTKYCQHTKACVEEFDHFCGWLNVAIGKGNHRTFIFLAIAEVSVQCVHVCLCIMVARSIIEGESYTDWLYNAAMQYPLLVFVFIIHMFSSPGIAMLLFNHLYLIAVNLTTNEMINVQRYAHFWEEVTQESGVKKRVYNNPFDKGSVRKNCIDFWWHRRRGEQGGCTSVTANGASSKTL